MNANKTQDTVKVEQFTGLTFVDLKCFITSYKAGMYKYSQKFLQHSLKLKVWPNESLRVNRTSGDLYHCYIMYDILQHYGAVVHCLGASELCSKCCHIVMNTWNNLTFFACEHPVKPDQFCQVIIACQNVFKLYFCCIDLVLGNA